MRERGLSALKHISVGRKVVLILAAAVIVFIFAQSLLPAEASAQESSFILRLIQGLLPESVLRSKAQAHQLVRKLAHVTEFCAIGVVLTILFRRRLLLPAAIGLLIALLDETIQIFTGRGASVKDIWIDFSGVVLGICIVQLVSVIIHAIRQHVSKRGQQ